MQFIFRGRFSKDLDTETAMGVTFTGREPSEVRDAAAINWLDGHPDYVRVAEEPLDHDGNGKKGGSKPKAKKKGSK